MNSMDYWNKVAKPPTAALKEIKGGRMSGKTDIKPQWRLQVMTETYGLCGIGWKYTIDRLWSEAGCDLQVLAFADISLYIKVDGEWSAAIPGHGGNMLTEKESKGLHSSDEAFKMAITDALSVAMKQIGVASEIYMGNWDGSKYKNSGPLAPPTPPNPQKPAVLSDDQQKYFPRVKAALDTLYGDDTAAKKSEIKILTTFPEKKEGKETGKMVDGVDDYRKLDGKRLQILCARLEKLAESKQAPVPCPECSKPLADNGRCSNLECPNGEPF